MKKITFLLFTCCVLSSFTALAQFSFPADAGPHSVVNGTPVTLNINDAANVAGATAGVYDSFSVSADWISTNNAWASEADLTMTTTAGGVLIDPPTGGSANSGSATTLTFDGNFAGIYDPSVDGTLSITLNAGYSGSSADWSNIVVTINPAPACGDPIDLAVSALDVSATVSWIAPTAGTPVGYNWEVQPDGVAQGTAGASASGIATGTSDSASGLTASTVYDLYVQTDCGGDGTSGWVGPYSFTTSDGPPPANNDCAGAISVTLGVSCGPDVTGTNLNASDSGVAQATCATATYSGGDIWYTFDMPAGETSLDYTRSASVFSTTQVELFSGTCGALVEEACTTDASNSFTGLTAGATYYLRLYDWGNDNFGDVTFCLGTPSTDTLEYYNLQWPASGTITDGDGHNVYAQCYEAGLTDVTSGQAAGVECWIGYSSTDTDPSSVTGWTWVVATFDSEAGNNDQYILDLDGSVGPGMYYYASRWSQNLGPYTYGGIQADGSFGGIWGADNNISGVLTVNAPPPPANDDCANATAITIFNNGDTQDASSATNNTGYVTDCGLGMNDGVWYTFNVIDAGTVDVAVTGVTGWDPELSVYSGSCGTFTCTSSADLGGSGVGESVSFAATASTQYWVNIGYYSSSSDGSEGPLTINISTTDTATLDTSLGVNDVNFGSFNYFPNPVEGTLSLRAQNNMQNVAVYNMLGQEVINISPNTMSNDLDMSALSRGTYFVRISINGAVENFKVIKE